MRFILFEEKKRDEICRRVFEIIQPCQHLKVEDYIIVFYKKKKRTVAYGVVSVDLPFCF